MAEHILTVQTALSAHVRLSSLLRNLFTHLATNKFIVRRRYKSTFTATCSARIAIFRRNIDVMRRRALRDYLAARLLDCRRFYSAWRHSG